MDTFSLTSDSYVSLPALLERASSLPDLARLLGVARLEWGGKMGTALEDPAAAGEVRRLETAVAVTDAALWQPNGDGRGLLHALDHGDLRELVELVEPNTPLEHLAVLRGLCGRPLREFFEAQEGPLLLDRGMPVPLPDRPLPEGDLPHTPHHLTLSLGQSLMKLPYRVFNRSAGDQVRVVLDFSQRERIDELGWSGQGRLPKIATVHPAIGKETVGFELVGDEQFFDVSPKQWDGEALLERLRQAKLDGAEIAILPELCMPCPDAIAVDLAEAPGEYPRLVIAGSAHVRETSTAGSHEIRANESRIYLDGEQVAVHRKFHPFEFKSVGAIELDRRRSEALTGEQKTMTILAGERTRTVVLICADLNDDRLSDVLISAGVNLMLVPSLTPSPGAFNAPICDIACYCQGVGAIANVELDGVEPGEERPFFAMASAPHPRSGWQSHEYVPEGEVARPAAGLLDPNLPLKRALKWLR